MSGRLVVVTGGGGGIGRALAARFADDRVLAPGRDECDVTDEASVAAFFREAGELRNVRLAEVANGDFANVVCRILLFSTVRLALLEQLRGSRDQVLAAVAAKVVQVISRELQKPENQRKLKEGISKLAQSRRR